MPRKRSAGRTTAPSDTTSSSAKSSKTSARARTKSTATPNLREKSARSLGNTALSSSPQNNKKYSNIPFNPNAIMTYQELIAALDSDDVAQITLASNIIAEDNIIINHDIAINFNGYSIISEETHPAVRVLDIRSGEVLLTGYGKIFAMGKNSVAIRAFGAISSGVPNYTTITIDKGISLFAPDSYGILISPNLGVAYGVTINLVGQIFAHDGICLAGGIRGYDPTMPSINIQAGAQIMADEFSGAAIEAAGYGKWSISAAQLHGAIGASLSTGILKFAGTQILASHDECFRILENTDALLEVAVEKGNYVSTNSNIVAGIPATIKKFEIKNCDFYVTTDAITEPLQKHVKTKKIAHYDNVQEFLDRLAASDVPTAVEATSLSEATPSTLPQTTPSADQIDFEDDLNESMIDWIGDESIEDLESEFEDLLDEPIEKPKKTKKPKKTPKAKIRKKSTKFDLNSIAELSDDATDEQEILSVLASENNLADDALAATTTRAATLATSPVVTESSRQSTAAQPVVPPKPTSILAPAPEPTIPPFTNEQDAARRALSDAIMDIRKLSAEDYDTGFSELEQAIRQAEQILANPLASLADICDAASTLLSAFDDLEERDDAALMSDDELDELFYHGAVLQEMLKESKKEKSEKHHKKHDKKLKTFLPESPKSAFADMPSLLEEINKRKTSPATSQLQVAPNSQDNNPNLAPNFANLSAVLTRIAELDLNSYTLASQEIMLATLSSAQAILTDANASQAAIDTLAAKLSEEIAGLVPLRQSYSSSAHYHVALTHPTPNIGSLAAPTMIDEMAPTSVWSLGVTMIDEMNPFITDATTREKMLRAMQSNFSIFKKSLIKPFIRIKRSLTAGFRAGINAYKETLHSIQS